MLFSSPVSPKTRKRLSPRRDSFTHNRRGSLFRKSVIKTFDVPINSYCYIKDDIFADSVPSKMVLAIVSSKAFNGSPYAREFRSLFTGAGMYGKNEGNYISRSVYAGGYTMFVFEIDP